MYAEHFPTADLDSESPRPWVKCVYDTNDIYLMLLEQSCGRKVRSVQNLIKNIAAILNNGRHFKISGHF